MNDLEQNAVDTKPAARFGVPIILMIAILLLAALVRFHNLGAQSLWYDEGVSYVHSLRSFPKLIESLQQNVHGPAYFALLGIYEDLTGHTEFALRSLSTLFSLLSIALTYALGKKLYGLVAGIAAAAFVALNTFSIYYAQEARMYAMLSAIGTASMLALVGFISRIHRTVSSNAGVDNKTTKVQHILSIRNNPMMQYGLALALLNALGMYTHYSYALVMVAQGVMAVLWLGATFYTEMRQSDTTRATNRVAHIFVRYVLVNLLTIMLFLPWLPLALGNVSEQSNVADFVPLDQMLRVIQGWFGFGRTFETSITGGIGAVMYFFLLFGLLILPGQPRKLRAWWKMLLPVVWVLVAAGGFLALALYTRYLRFLLPAQIGFALWMGRGVWILWHLQTREQNNALKYLPKFAAVFGLVVFLGNMLNGLDPLYNAPEHQRDNYRGLAQILRTELRAGDAIILNAASQSEVFCYYYACDESVHLLPTTADDAITRADTQAIIAQSRRIYAVLWGESERDPLGIVESTLNQETYPVSDEWFDGSTIRLVRFVVPADMGEAIASEARFGKHIMLTQFQLNTDAIQPGDVLQLQLYWVTDTPLDTRYKVFVQLLNSDGSLNTQRDSEPGGGQQLTTNWQVDETIVDNHALPIPANLPPGDYTVIIGVYDLNPPNMRLPVGETDYLELLRFSVE